MTRPVKPSARRRRRCLARASLLGVAAILAAFPALSALPASAIDAPGALPARTWVVAARQTPPFAMKDSAGNWEGLSIDLWQDVADKIGVLFEWRELELGDTLAALERGEIDVAVAALTVTAEREGLFDFSYPYLNGGLALAVDPSRSSGWLATLRAFFSLEFLTAVAALVFVLMAAAFGVWTFERRANPEQFGGSTAHGLFEGFWWSAVTMTTVGYGDRAPITLGGRLVALVWMFTSVIVIAGFTASIAASVTVNRLESDLLDTDRLSRLRIGVLSDSSAASFGAEHGLRTRGYPSLEEAARALRDGGVEALMHDEPILQHFARVNFDDAIEVVPGVLVRDDYAFGLAPGSPLRKPINVALLSILHEPVWQSIRARYLGANDGD